MKDHPQERRLWQCSVSSESFWVAPGYEAASDPNRPQIAEVLIVGDIHQVHEDSHK